MNILDKIIAHKEKEVAVENERVDKERLLELTEKEKLVALATIEKDRVVEEEGKWSKTETVKLDSILKSFAHKRILQDSLLSAASIQFQKYIES